MSRRNFVKGLMTVLMVGLAAASHGADEVIEVDPKPCTGPNESLPVGGIANGCDCDSGFVWNGNTCDEADLWWLGDAIWDWGDDGNPGDGGGHPQPNPPSGGDGGACSEQEWHAHDAMLDQCDNDFYTTAELCNHLPAIVLCQNDHWSLGFAECEPVAGTGGTAVICEFWDGSMGLFAADDVFNQCIASWSDPSTGTDARKKCHVSKEVAYEMCIEEADHKVPDCAPEPVSPHPTGDDTLATVESGATLSAIGR